MATTATVLIPVQGAKLPTSEAALIDGGKHHWRLMFPDSTDRHAFWQWRMPHDYNSDLTIHMQYIADSGTAGILKMGAAVMAVTPGDAADLTATSFGSVVYDTSTAPTTIGYMSSTGISITLTGNADSLAANDFIKLEIVRDADHAGDTLTGHAAILAVSAEYMTT